MHCSDDWAMCFDELDYLKQKNLSLDRQRVGITRSQTLNTRLTFLAAYRACLSLTLSPYSCAFSAFSRSVKRWAC